MNSLPEALRKSASRSELRSEISSFFRETGLDEFAREGGLYEASGSLAESKITRVISKPKDKVLQNPIASESDNHFDHSSNSSTTLRSPTIPSLKRFGESEDDDPRELKKMRFTGAWASAVDKGSKGLRHFSMKVCQKVQQKGVTTYNEVADELVAELVDPLKPTPTSEQIYDQKNIRRRVYDALNVLMAINVISKEKKEIKWVGLPTNSAQELQNLEAERNERLSRIKKKQKQLNELVLQQLSFKNLIRRNKALEAQCGPPQPNTVVKLPFVVINTGEDTDIDCSISYDKKEYLFNFDSGFEVHDDVEVLRRMGMTLGLESGSCTTEDLNQALAMLPDSLHPYVRRMAGV